MGEPEEVTMSGHNKWSTIQHKKGKADAARGKLFTKLIKEITVAARMGGGSEESNPRLRTAVEAARAANMPVENVTRAIKKGTGELEGVSYDDVTYEGYGPEGVAILVRCLTDNKNRTVSEVRRVFAKHNCKMAEPGSVAWIFRDAGRIEVEAEGVTEDALMEVVLEAGAEAMEKADESFIVTTQLEGLDAVRTAIEADGYKVVEAIPTKLPANYVELEGRPAESLLKLLDSLESLDDTQNIWDNSDMPDSVLEEMA